jgi:hypothetical protein
MIGSLVHCSDDVLSEAIDLDTDDFYGVRLHVSGEIQESVSVLLACVRVVSYDFYYVLNVDCVGWAKLIEEIS